MGESLDVIGIADECRGVLRDPVYSGELCSKLIQWLEIPNAAISDIAGRCLIKLGSHAFDDLLGYVTRPGATIWPNAVWVLSSSPAQYEQMIPLLRSWLANAAGRLESQCALSLAVILQSQHQAGLAPAERDIDACRHVFERDAKTSPSARLSLRQLDAEFGTSGNEFAGG